VQEVAHASENRGKVEPVRGGNHFVIAHGSFGWAGILCASETGNRASHFENPNNRLRGFVVSDLHVDKASLRVPCDLNWRLPDLQAAGYCKHFHRAEITEGSCFQREGLDYQLR